MKERLIQFNEKYHLFQKGDGIVIGVSGGADSVCLLHLLQEWKKEWDLSLYVLHVHHGIRGQEADEDARFVEQLAKSMELPFRLVRENVPELAKREGLTEEEAGRKCRYQSLETYRKEMGATHIAVAHHQNDQAETVLFQLFRGSGLRGLAGMPVKRGAIIRPLLFAKRQEMEAYLKEKGLSFREDATNREVIYARNKIRHQILPRAEEINAQAVSHISQAAAKLADWQCFIEKMGQQAYERMVQEEERGCFLSVTEFLQEDAVIQGEILRKIFETNIPGAKDIEQVHYEQVLSLLNGQTGKRVHLPKGLEARREYDKIYFSLGQKKEKEKFTKQVCNLPFRHIVKSDGILYEIVLELKNREDLPETIPQKDYTKWLDYDMIKNELVLRSPCEEDYFVMNQSGSRKKLNRFYIDQKVPRDRRKEQIVLADGSHVMWLIQGRISEAYKISDNTKRVLVITKERICHERRN